MPSWCSTPWRIEPVPPEPPDRNPPIVERAVDGYIRICWPVASAARSSSTNVAPASAVERARRDLADRAGAGHVEDETAGHRDRLAVVAGALAARRDRHAVADGGGDRRRDRRRVGREGDDVGAPERQLLLDDGRQPRTVGRGLGEALVVGRVDAIRAEQVGQLGDERGDVDGMGHAAQCRVPTSSCGGLRHASGGSAAIHPDDPALVMKTSTGSRSPRRRRSATASRTRSAPAADREAVQAPPARPLLGQHDVQDRVRPPKLLSRG